MRQTKQYHLAMLFVCTACSFREEIIDEIDEMNIPIVIISKIIIIIILSLLTLMFMMQFSCCPRQCVIIRMSSSFDLFRAGVPPLTIHRNEPNPNSEFLA